MLQYWRMGYFMYALLTFAPSIYFFLAFPILSTSWRRCLPSVVRNVSDNKWICVSKNYVFELTWKEVGYNLSFIELSYMSAIHRVALGVKKTNKKPIVDVDHVDFWINESSLGKIIHTISYSHNINTDFYDFSCFIVQIN